MLLRERLIHFALVFVILLSFTGCLTFETFITVRPDGSGTVVQTFILTSEMLQMALMFGGEEGAEFCDEEDLVAEAAKMGEGVQYVSSEPIDEDESIGCRAVFAFDDINNLLINYTPEDQMPSGMTEDAPDPEEEDTAQQDLVTFQFDPGSPSTLVVKMDHAPPSEAQDTDETPVDSTQRAQEMMMIREMFEGARMALLLEIEGSIEETNASFVDGNNITLMDIDFDKMLEDEENLALLIDTKPETTEDMKALMQQVEGIKIETEDVTIRFD